jgi:hypothetical protein
MEKIIVNAADISPEIFLVYNIRIFFLPCPFESLGIF